MTKLQSVQKLLDSESTGFKQIVTRAKILNQINCAFREILPSALQGHVMIMNIREHVVIIGADSAARMTQLRFESQALLEGVKQISGLGDIQHIQFKIQPTTATSSSQNHRRATMSRKASAVLKHAADSFDDPTLKSAFKKLSNNHT